MVKTRLNIELLGTLGSVLYLSASDMACATNIAISTWYYIIQNPESMTIQQLLSISNGLCIPVRRFFSTGNTKIIGLREDYITEPYIPCYYDSDLLQTITSSKHGKTWQKASVVAGVTPARLKKSLMGTTRTPITRFLSVCEAFEINPFDVLIDPNPEKSSRNKQCATTQTTTNRALNNKNNEPSIISEIQTLNKRIDQINEKLYDLTKKYEKLIADNKKQINSTKASKEQFMERYLSASVVAEPSDDVEQT